MHNGHQKRRARIPLRYFQFSTTASIALSAMTLFSPHSVAAAGIYSHRIVSVECSRGKIYCQDNAEVIGSVHFAKTSEKERLRQPDADFVPADDTDQVTSQAEEKTDYSTWIGTEATNLPAAINEFESLCWRRYQHSVEKTLSSYPDASVWNRAHCRCIGTFFEIKDSLTFVQVVNAYLKNILDKKPRLPGELNVYFEGYDAVQSACMEDPLYTSEASQVEIERIKRSRK